MGTLKKHFEKQLEQSQKQENSFNIFTALHKETDERRLHSRFISYLLSSNKEFLRLFFEIEELKKNGLKIEDFENSQVLPNEKVKEEHADIDILILSKKRAIIIENKIFAGDSNGKDKNGQEIPQLLVYFEKIKDELKRCRQNLSEDEARKNIKLVYLRLNKKPPSLSEKFTNYNLSCIEYATDIKKWLEKCQTAVEQENDLLSKIINQYKDLITKLTSDLNQATDNQQKLSEKFEEALELKKYLTGKCFEIFKHVQWHIVADFFDKLEIALNKRIKANIDEKPKPEDITKVTHNKNRSSITKLIIKFRYNGTNLQIVNDKSNGFTLGNLDDGKWGYFSDEIKSIKFCDFSDEKTFYVIKEDYRNEIIEKMITEIAKHHKENYTNLKKTF